MMIRPIDNIEWTVYGKIKKISKRNGVDIAYTYDAAGNRISKDVKGQQTWYVRDAKITSAQDYYPFGMLMPGRNGHHIAGGWSTGSSVVNGYTVPESLTLGSRAGNQPGEYTASQTINFTEGFNSGINDVFNATIADDSYNGSSGGTGDGSNVAVSGYRFGFNGKENDNEVKGEGNQQDYGMRIYDPRIAKFLSIDPITSKYPELTPYQFASNSPIFGIDQDGLEIMGFGYLVDELSKGASKLGLLRVSGFVNTYGHNLIIDPIYSSHSVVKSVQAGDAVATIKQFDPVGLVAFQTLQKLLLMLLMEMRMHKAKF